MGATAGVRTDGEPGESVRGRAALRLEELKAELSAGRLQLHDLEERRRELEETLLRISGAIQILEEVLATPHDVAALERAEG